MKNHIVWWEISLFLGPCSIAMLNYQKVYLVILTYLSDVLRYNVAWGDLTRCDLYVGSCMWSVHRFGNFEVFPSNHVVWYSLTFTQSINMRSKNPQWMPCWLLSPMEFDAFHSQPRFQRTRAVGQTTRSTHSIF